MREMKFKRSSRTSLSKAPSAAAAAAAAPLAAAAAAAGRLLSHRAPRDSRGLQVIPGDDSALDRYSRH